MDHTHTRANPTDVGDESVGEPFVAATAVEKAALGKDDGGVVHAALLGPAAFSDSGDDESVGEHDGEGEGDGDGGDGDETAFYVPRKIVGTIVGTSDGEDGDKDDKDDEREATTSDIVASSGLPPASCLLSGNSPDSFSKSGVEPPEGAPPIVRQRGQIGWKSSPEPSAKRRRL
jgi:hypothetical protein